MGCYTKIDKQIDKYYDVVSKNISLSRQMFYLKVTVLLLVIFNVIVIVEHFI